MNVVHLNRADTSREAQPVSPRIAAVDRPVHWLDLVINRQGPIAAITCIAPHGAHCRLGCSQGCDLAGLTIQQIEDHPHPISDQGVCQFLDATDFAEDDPLESYCGEVASLRSGPIDLVWDPHALLYRWRFSETHEVSGVRMVFSEGITAPQVIRNPSPSVIADADHHAASSAAKGGSHTIVGSGFLLACRWCDLVFFGETYRDADDLRVAHERDMSRGTVTQLHPR